MKCRCTIALLIIALACVVSSGDDTAPPSKEIHPKSAAAVSAMQKHDKAVAKAKEAYDKALIVADTQEIKDLQQALTAATKAGNLDEAEAIKAERDSAVNDQKQAEADLAGEGKVAKWAVWHVDVNGSANTFWIMPDGRAFTSNDHGTWQRKGDTITINWQGARHADVIELSDTGTPVRGTTNNGNTPMKITSVGSDLTGEAPPPDLQSH